jgi:rhodanese-related sulfurtransferase
MADPLQLSLKILGFALSSALLALLIANRRSASKGADEEEAASARRRMANELEQLREEASRLRALLDRHARGLPVTPAMIEDGQLWEDVDGPEAQRRVEAGAAVLDVRTHGEVASGRVPGALHIPMQELEERLNEVPRDRPLLVYCAAGARSAAVCEALSQRPGFPELLNLDAGLPAWPGPLERPST